MGIHVYWHAKSGGTYYISKDQEVVGQPVIVHSQSGPTTDNATRTLVQSLAATDTNVRLNTSLPTGTLVAIDNEIIRLGPWQTNQHIECERGYGGSIPESHAANATAYALQASWEDTNVFFPEGRHVITYWVQREDSSGLSIPTMTRAITLPTPPSHRHICLWGIVERIDGTPASGIPVHLSLGDTNDYLVTGEYLLGQRAETQTGVDGFFSIFVPKDVFWRSGGGTRELQLTIAPQTAMAYQRVITVVSAQLESNFLRLT